jgi:hypothetical protein
MAGQQLATGAAFARERAARADSRNFFTQE